MKIYVDTSFLVSLYSLDANSAAAARAMQSSPADRLLTAFGELELFNALGLRLFRKEVTARQAKSSLKDFESDLRDGIFQLRVLPDSVFERALRLSRQTTPRLGTRSADVLHVAAALELGVDYLYSFDERQRKLARAVRLKLN
ncbi:MAG: type II toxin-antitoxin system VapC family toxin [Candidatus Acidiferrales bacterium]